MSGKELVKVEEFDITKIEELLLEIAIEPAAPRRVPVMAVGTWKYCGYCGRFEVFEGTCQFCTFGERQFDEAGNEIL